MLEGLVTQDQYNAFCIDCQKNRSTHANIFFGTFICGDCADFHRNMFDMMHSYIKTVFDEPWDPYQKRVAGCGGNKAFYEFMKDYGKERDAILKKYKNSAADYYKKRLAAQCSSKPFDELAPPKNASEAFDYAG